MAFLQRWLDEPDESIGRMAKGFYALTFLFLALFAWQMVGLMLDRGAPLTKGDAVGPLVALFLTMTMYLLALDGRRSHKALKEAAKPDGTAGPATKT